VNVTDTFCLTGVVSPVVVHVAELDVSSLALVVTSVGALDMSVPNGLPVAPR
jgi:hypothetical protein